MAMTDADRTAINAALTGLDAAVTTLGVAASSPGTFPGAVDLMTQAKVTTDAIRSYIAAQQPDTSNASAPASPSLAAALASVQIKTGV